MDNWTIAQRLIERAHELQDQPANLYRVRAYRRAAETVLGLDRPLEGIVEESGRKGLRQLPGIVLDRLLPLHQRSGLARV